MPCFQVILTRHTPVCIIQIQGKLYFLQVTLIISNSFLKLYWRRLYNSRFGSFDIIDLLIFEMEVMTNTLTTFKSYTGRPVVCIWSVDWSHEHLLLQGSKASLTQRPKWICFYAKLENFTSCSLRRKKYFLEANELYLTNPPRTQHNVKMQIYERKR